ncbi:MAG: branched-chain amino acid ABC transporter permease [Clostridiales bacterium]|nr:branched-chain amino acid ABC transporter permease [Clostridiales bacterium]
MKKKPLATNLVTLAMVVALFIVMFTLSETGILSRHMRSMLVPVCINIILAVSLNLLVGFLGELTLGHAGFMSVGAYAGCLFSIAMKEILPMAIRFPLAMLVGGLVAAVFGIVIGIPVLRLHGDYLAIVTLAFGEIIRSVIINLEFTGGAAGLKGTPQDSTFVIAFIVVMITLLVTMNLVNSRHGRAITAIRDNRIAAEASGINVTYFRMLAFVIAAFFAGVAGVLYGHNLSILTAGTFDYNKSIELLVIVVLGGMGSIRGSVISAIIITLLPEVLRDLADYRMLIYALVLIIMMLLNASPRFAAFKTRFSPGAIKAAIKAKKAVKEGNANE